MATFMGGTVFILLILSLEITIGLLTHCETLLLKGSLGMSDLHNEVCTTFAIDGEISICLEPLWQS